VTSTGYPVRGKNKSKTKRNRGGKAKTSNGNAETRLVKNERGKVKDRNERTGGTAENDHAIDVDLRAVTRGTVLPHRSSLKNEA